MVCFVENCSFSFVLTFVLSYSNAHGFFVHNCTENFNIEIGQRKTLFISFQPDFSSSLVQRELFLYTSQGLVVLPVIAKFGIDQLALCNESQVFVRSHK